MEAIKWIAILLLAYGLVVIAFEAFVAFMGTRQAAAGIRADEEWLVLNITDAQGSRKAVVAGVESRGRLDVAANHWPRSWFKRAIENPKIEVNRAGKTLAYRALPVMGEERVQVARDYHLPWVVRVLAGFPPRAFLRLEPR